MAKEKQQAISTPAKNTKVVNGAVAQGKIVQTIVKNGSLSADDHSPEATGIVQ